MPPHTADGTARDSCACSYEAASTADGSPGVSVRVRHGKSSNSNDSTALIEWVKASQSPILPRLSSSSFAYYLHEARRSKRLLALGVLDAADAAAYAQAKRIADRALRMPSRGTSVDGIEPVEVVIESGGQQQPSARRRRFPIGFGHYYDRSSSNSDNTAVGEASGKGAIGGSLAHAALAAVPPLPPSLHFLSILMGLSAASSSSSLPSNSDSRHSHISTLPPSVASRLRFAYLDASATAAAACAAAASSSHGQWQGHRYRRFLEQFDIQPVPVNSASESISLSSSGDSTGGSVKDDDDAGDDLSNFALDGSGNGDDFADDFGDDDGAFDGSEDYFKGDSSSGDANERPDHPYDYDADDFDGELPGGGGHDDNDGVGSESAWSSDQGNAATDDVIDADAPIASTTAASASDSVGSSNHTTISKHRPAAPSYFTPRLVVIDPESGVFWTDPTAMEWDEIITFLEEVVAGTAPVQRAGVKDAPPPLRLGTLTGRAAKVAKLLLQPRVRVLLAQAGLGAADPRVQLAVVAGVAIIAVWLLLWATWKLVLVELLHSPNQAHAYPVPSAVGPVPVAAAGYPDDSRYYHQPHGEGAVNPSVADGSPISGYHGNEHEQEQYWGQQQQHVTPYHHDGYDDNHRDDQFKGGQGEGEFEGSEDDDAE